MSIKAISFNFLRAAMTVVLFTCVTMSAIAYDFKVNNIYYNINDDENTVSVTYKDTNYHCYSGSITIPSTVTYNGKTYTVTTIGYHAMGICELTSVTIPNTVTTIDDYAFFNSYKLTSITIPKSVTHIGDNVFRACFGLTTMKVANDNPVYDSRDACNAIIETATNTIIYGCKTTVIPNSVYGIGNNAFAGHSLTSFTLPKQIAFVGEGAIACSLIEGISVAAGNTKYDSRQNCNAIIEKSTNTLIAGCKKTVIPNTVTAIGAYSFWDCDGLKSITIPSSVTSIGHHSFYCCSGLTSIVIPNSVKTIGNGAFFICLNLASATIGNSVTTIGSYAFSSTKLTSITIPNSVSYLGDWALSQNSSLQTVTLSNALTSIELGTFHSCSALSNITIPNSVISIGNSAFMGCTSLPSITIPELVTSIGPSAFAGCSSMKSATLGKSVKLLSNNAFNNCNALKTVTCESIVPPVMANRNCFTTTAYTNAELKVPMGAISTYRATDYWYLFDKITGYGIIITGDVNGDGLVDVLDVSYIIGHVLGENPYPFIIDQADLDMNGEISIEDVTKLIGMILKQ